MQVDHELGRAFAHPLRVEILAELGGGTASPKQLAKGLGKTLSDVSYHVTVLKETGALRKVRTQPVRGATQHFYRATSLAQSFLSVHLDSKGYEEVSAAIDQASSRVQVAHKKSAKRLAEAKKRGDDATIILASFPPAKVRRGKRDAGKA